MPSYQLKTDDQILGSMSNEVIAQTTLSDFTDSSNIKHDLGAASKELHGYYFALTRLRNVFGLRARGSDLDERILDFPGVVELRRRSRKAVGRVRFERAVASVSSLDIAQGVLVRASTGQLYRTIQAAAIAASGTLSNEVTALAVSAGASGNVAAGQITGFGGAAPSGVTAVTNTTRMAYGRDQESDDELVARLRDYVAGLAGSQVQAMRQLLLGVTDAATGKSIIRANVLEDPEDLGKLRFYVDDGAGTAGAEVTPFTALSVISSAVGTEQYVKVGKYPLVVDATADFVLRRTRAAATTTLVRGTDYFLNPATGLIKFAAGTCIAGDAFECDCTKYDGLIEAAHNLLYGLASDRSQYPGKRAGGVQVRVLPATPVVITVAGTVKLTSAGDETSVDQAELDVIDYVSGIQDTADDTTVWVVRNEIVERIMSVDGIFDLSLTSPAANTPIAPHQVPIATTGSVSLSTE